MTESLQSAEHDRRIDYIELSVTDVAAAKRFYGQVFGWRFEDYGPDYASFADGRLSGGLEAAEKRVTGAGGRIVRSTLSFPGVRRFHLADPSGNELAVWSDSKI